MVRNGPRPLLRGLMAGALALCLTAGALAAEELPDSPSSDGASSSETVSSDGSGGSGNSGGSTVRGSVRLSDSSLDLGVGVSTRLRGTPTPETAQIVWSTPDTDLIQISNETGPEVYVRTLAPGQATIYARVGSGDPAVCTVRISGVTLTPTSTTIVVNATEDIDLNVFGNAASVANWEWSSSNTGVVTVARRATGCTVLGVAEGTATVSVNGGGWTSSCTVRVVRNEAGTVEAVLTDGVLRFSSIAASFRTRCRQLTGEELSYLTGLTVRADLGTLYDGYVSEGDTGHGVAQERQYSAESDSGYRMEDITFVPKPTVTGEVEIRYTGYSTGGKSFNGAVRVTVDSRQGGLAYTSPQGGPIALRAEDFSAYCLDMTHRSLRYVTFKLPDSKYGRLYYKYQSDVVYGSTVKSDTRYYRSSAPKIDDVSFVPASGYMGTFLLSFTGADTEGATFSGTARITVSNNDQSSSDSEGDIVYEVRRGSRVSFRTADFTDLCDERTGEGLSRIRFTSLPAEARGVLYYDGDTAVGTSTSYYRTGSGRRIADLSFVAGPSWTGTLTIPFIGTDEEDGTFTGSVGIVVTATGGGGGETAVYRTSGPAVALRSSDLTRTAETVLGSVDTIRIYAPPAAAGKLVRKFVSPGDYEAFDVSKAWTPAEIDQVWFLPKAGFEGSATITYVARDSKGTVYSSVFRVEVTPPTSSAYFRDLAGRSWAVPAVDFFRNYGILNGTTSTTYDPDGTARRGQYMAVLGRMFKLPTTYPSGFLTDVRTGTYYAPYFAAASALGIVTPNWEGRVFPDAPITRQDAAVWLYRCMSRSGTALTGDRADLRSFSDWAQIDEYALDGMASMVRMGVFQGDDYRRLNPHGALTRLQMAAVLYRAMTA